MDFAPAPSEIVIPAGKPSAEFLLQANFDTLQEPIERVVIRIGPPLFPLNPDPANTIYEIDSDGREAQVDIYDNSGMTPPTVSLRQVVEATREARPGEEIAPAIFAVHRNGPLDNDLRVYLSYGRHGDHRERLRKSWRLDSNPRGTIRCSGQSVAQG